MKSNNSIFVICVVVLLAGLGLSYSNHFHNGFQFDDYHTIVNNGYIKDLSNIPKFFTDNSTMSTNLGNRSYRPIVATLNAIDYSIGGMDPFWFHVSIFTSYLILIVFIYIFMRNLFNQIQVDSWNKYFALFGAAFFGYHAANAETVNYIISRSDSFSTLCIVATLLMFQYRPTKKSFAYLIPLVIGIYTKQVGVVAIPLLYIYIILFDENLGKEEIISSDNRKNYLSALKKIIPALFIGIGIFITNQFILTKGPSANLLSEMSVSRWQYFSTQWYVIAHYIGNFILPVNLSADPDISVINTLWDVKKMLGLAVISALLFVAYRTSKSKKYRPITFGILWFFISLTPTSTFHPLGQVSNDHRTFLPFIGLFIAVTWSIALFVAKYKTALTDKVELRAILLSLIAMLLGGHAYGVYQRNIVWSSSDLLWEDVANKSPNNGRGLMNYGLTLMAKGDYQGTLVYFNRAMELMPYYSYLHINMGVLNESMGYTEKAEQYYKNAINLDRNNIEAYHYYARYLWSHKRSKEALSFAEQGLRISPGHEVLAKLYLAIKNSGAPSDTQDMLEQRIESGPNEQDLINLSLMLYNQGRYELCLNACERAVEINPNSKEGYNNMCIALIKLKRYDEAIAACERAVKLAPDFTLAKNNLNWARSLKSQ